MLILGSLHTLCWVSLIAGWEEYRVHGTVVWKMGWNNAWVWIIRVTGAVVQGCASYYMSRALTSLQRLYEHVQFLLF